MEVVYNVEGMTCGNCVAKVTSLLERIPKVQSAKVDLSTKSATVFSQVSLDLNELQNAVGKYKLSPSSSKTNSEVLPQKSIETYKPLILIILFILGVCILAQYPFSSFDWSLWMRHFMGGFFIVFSFFKLLNLSSFADSYSMYDIIAGRWKAWGYIYPFVELGLGILFLIGIWPTWTAFVTILILVVSSIGVIQSNIQKRKIKCACLGDVFNLPMSTVTIVENVSMIIMAAFMLINNSINSFT